MNANQIQLVQTTFNNHVAPLGDAAATVFYQNLFALDPSLRALFAGDMAAQGHKLVQTLAFAVGGLHAPDGILDAVRQLGQRHVGYGVQAEHYDTVGQALVQTLQTAIGPAFTSEVREAWVAVYAQLASAMQSSAPILESA
ncbi:MAG: hemin receptor [Anaerolineae bacterium]|nr:hemin receptor [Anaerolineae bacterium]